MNYFSHNPLNRFSEMRRTCSNFGNGRRSLFMVGFHAPAVNRNLYRNTDGLEDARWFTRSEIAAGLRDGSLRLPPLISISYRLICDWYNADPAYKLEEVISY